MSLQIIIAGVNRTADVKLDGFDIEQVLGAEQDSCSFVLKSGDKPTEGQEVIIYDPLTTAPPVNQTVACDFIGYDPPDYRYFAGIITNPKEDEKTHSIVFFNVEAVDYTYQLDRKLVIEVYENISASDIAIDILAKYCPGFSNTGIVSGAPEVEYIKFDYIRPSEAFQQLAEYVGWNWYVDYFREVKFFQSYNAFAPVEITATSEIRKLSHNPDIQGLKNRVYILGGNFLSDYATFEYVADGVQRLWVLGHEPHDPSVEVSEVQKTIGLENVDDESLCDFMYNQKEKYIRCSNQTPTPVNGATMSFTYKYPMPVITMVEDIASQQAVAAIQGGDGIYEHKIVDDSLITIEAAEAAGNAVLAQHANPKIKGSFETEIIGFAPGQLLTINLPGRGIIGQFVIQRVNISALKSDRMIFKITYGGRLKGIPDLLQALVSKQQQKKLQDVEYQTKIEIRDEYVGIFDELIVSPRTDPWYCGDVDAICGEIICL